ncbi:MAG: cofactor assembly of complex C subunit B [Leptolyngbya sp. SIO1E4]|nr:cofactor assembly of complex C subunit B [Leptolyngbya sp. SIO1E4]
MTSTYDFALPSVFGLTFLLFIGLGFFIRASTKDRTEKARYLSELDDVTLLETLQHYFANRAYRVTGVEPEVGRISLEGMVGASVFLAGFLGGLAGIGLFCLALVIAIASPTWGYTPYWLLLLTPIAPWFYWRGATRSESVTFQLDPLEPDNQIAPQKGTQLVVSAHRDELIALESQIRLKRIEAE